MAARAILARRPPSPSEASSSASESRSDPDSESDFDVEAAEVRPATTGRRQPSPSETSASESSEEETKTKTKTKTTAKMGARETRNSRARVERAPSPSSSDLESSAFESESDSDSDSESESESESESDFEAVDRRRRGGSRRSIVRRARSVSATRGAAKSAAKPGAAKAPETSSPERRRTRDERTERERGRFAGVVSKGDVVARTSSSKTAASRGEPERAPLLSAATSESPGTASFPPRFTFPSTSSTRVRLYALTSAAILGTVMVAVGARHVLVRGSNPDPVSAATAASEPTTRRRHRPFPIAGIRDEYDDDDGGFGDGVLTREDVSWLVKEAREAAAREREGLKRDLADRGVLVDDEEEEESDADPFAARGENASPPDPIFDEPATTTTDAGVASRAVVTSEPEPVREPEPEPEPAPAVAAAAEETRPDVALAGEEEEDRQPRITPEMTYDEKQAEYARFAAEEAQRNDRIAAEAAEADRLARERQEEEDRLAAERAEEQRRAVALDDIASGAAAEVATETATEEAQQPPQEPEPQPEARASEPLEPEPEPAQASLAMVRSTSRLPVAAELDLEAGPGERLVVKVPDDVNEDAEAMVEPLEGGSGRGFDPKTRDRRARAANIAGLASRSR